MSDTGGMAPPPPPPPGTGGGGGFHERGLGEILSAAWNLYTKNAAQLIQLVAVIVIPLTLLQALLITTAFKTTTASVIVNQTTGEVSVTSGSGFFGGLGILAVTALISAVISQVLTGALTRGGAGSLLGRPVDIAASYRYAFSRLAGLIGLALLIGLVVGVGFILLFVPGLIFMVFLSMAVPSFIVERKGVTESMSRSWNLVTGSWWHVFGTIVVAAILAGVVAGVIGAVGGTSFFGRWITGAVAQILTAPFTALVAVVLYVDLRIRREALTAETLASELDAASA